MNFNQNSCEIEVDREGTKTRIKFSKGCTKEHLDFVKNYPTREIDRIKTEQS